MSRKQIYDERIELLVSWKQKEKIMVVAEKEDKTMNQFLRDMIDEYFTTKTSISTR